MESEGQPTEEPPADSRPDVSQILGAVVPAPSVLAPIPEEGELMPGAAELGPETRPRQPESEPGSEPVDRNVRPRLASDQQVTQLDEVENQPCMLMEMLVRHQTELMWTIRLMQPLRHPPCIL